jgi:hypothetical protein
MSFKTGFDNAAANQYGGYQKNVSNYAQPNGNCV